MSQVLARWLRRATPIVLGVVFVCAANFVLGFIEFPTEIGGFAKWGIYAGEFLVLATWLAWGMDGFLNRCSLVAWIGIPWGIAPWVGFAFAKPNRVFSYSHEFSQIFTVVPLAIVISSLPLLLMRSWRWGFQRDLGRIDDTSRSHLVSLGSLVVVSFVIGLACCFDRWLSIDIVVSLVIGGLLGVVASIVSPLLSVGILGAKIKLLPVIVAVIVVSLPGLVLTSLGGMPGPGAASTVHFHKESVVASSFALVPLITAYGCWRRIGIRSQLRRELAQERPCQESSIESS